MVELILDASLGHQVCPMRCSSWNFWEMGDQRVLVETRNRDAIRMLNQQLEATHRLSDKPRYSLRAKERVIAGNSAIARSDPP